ncbi:Ig-like domain-containing protein [Aphelenchoides fujianensis]|nr:Ig-like domain-containing protein [Aphelenchoides fujianensis]
MNSFALLFGLLSSFFFVQTKADESKECVVEGRLVRDGEFVLVHNCVTTRGTSIPLGTLLFVEDGFNYTCKNRMPAGRAPKLSAHTDDEVAEECEAGAAHFVREGFVVSCTTTELLGCADAFGDLIREGLFVTARGALRSCYVYVNRRRAKVERRGCFNGSRTEDPNDRRFHFRTGQLWKTPDFDYRCGEDGFQGVAWFDRDDVLNFCQLN